MAMSPTDVPAKAPTVRNTVPFVALAMACGWMKSISSKTITMIPHDIMSDVGAVAVSEILISHSAAYAGNMGGTYGRMHIHIPHAISAIAKIIQIIVN